MNPNLKKLNALDQLLGLDNFYCISFYGSGRIELQGKFDSDLVKKIMSNKFKPLSFDESGYAYFVRNNIKITLT